MANKNNQIKKGRPSNNKSYKQSRDNKIVGIANAPYNFIPLQDVVIYDDDFYEKLKLNKYDKDLFTGYIDLIIKNKTPLFIGGNKDTSNFFSPNGKIKIPGSSIRGMVRNLVEIVSYSKFQYFDNKLLFYRGLADKSSLNKEYRNNMTSENRNNKKSSIYKFSAGYLFKYGIDDYYILPALEIGGKQYKQIPKEYDKLEEEFTFRKLEDNSYLVVPGKFKRKDKYSNNWVIYPLNKNAEKIYIPREDIEQYKNDKGRYSNEKNGDGNLLRLLEKHDFVPCFYVEWTDENGEKRISFGHTGFFRLAYKKTIGEHIPIHLWNEKDKIDMAEAIFGKEGSHAGRVQFEDAILLSNQNDIQTQEIKLILSDPKPTSFQLYLEQDSRNIKQLKHWNNDVKIRGHKLYWHRDISKNKRLFTQFEQSKFSKVVTELKPIINSLEFKGRVRFQNLSKEELGALLFVLELPENHYHKIGMGKPFGLGSIEIIPKLYLSNRISRYQKLFDNNNWHLAEQQAETDVFKEAFEKYIINKLEMLNSCDKGTNSLWEIDRLKQLKIMLNWENTKIPNWLSKTNYMELDEFKERKILNKPVDVIKG